MVHLGQGNWLVVDSCIDPRSSRPAPLQYLESLGVDAGQAVKVVLASHWHDDHVRGLATVLEACSSAEFWVSQALVPREFLQLVHAFEPGSMIRGTSGTREFGRVLELLDSRSRPEERSPRWAVADRLIWRADSGPVDCRIHAMSPSDASITLAKRQLQRLFPEEMTPKRRLPAQSENHFAVVLWIEIGGANLLLGGDLLETGDPATGWSAVLGSSIRSGRRASVFKVPHHGSLSAHHDDVWTEMLGSEPLAVLTPWARGGRYLPTSKDIDRILGLAGEAYSASAVRRPKPKFASRTVQRTVTEVAKRVWVAEARLGHLRCRKEVASDGPWRVDRFGGACALSGALQ